MWSSCSWATRAGGPSSWGATTTSSTTTTAGGAFITVPPHLSPTIHHPRGTYDRDRLRLRRHRLLPRQRARRRPVSLLRLAPHPVPGAPRAAAGRLHGHRVRRGLRGLQRHRHLLVVQRRDRTVPGLPRAAGGSARRQRTDRSTPPRASVQRPDHDDGPARTPRSPAPGHAPAHPEAVEGERGVRVAPGRPPDRRVPGAGRGRVHQRLRQPVHPVRHRRSSRCTGGGARRVPARRCPAARTRAQSAARRT